MPDMTVTWKGAVSFDSLMGQSASSSATGVQFDAYAMASDFDIRPMHDSSVESALKGARPYVADDGADFDWADEFNSVLNEVEVVKPRGRPKKVG